MNFTHTLICIWVLGGVFGLAEELSAQPPLGVKTCDLPRDRLLGRFIVYPRGDPVPTSTLPKGGVATIPAEQPKVQSSELRATISYPLGSGLGIILGDDEHGTAREKLEALAPLESKDVRSLRIATEVDFACLKLIERFENLRELSLVVDEWLDRDPGCASLERLKKLRYLGLSRENSCIFGSTRFCEAICELKELRYLSIPCEKLTDRNVVTLARHPSLSQLYLRSRRPVLGRQALNALSSVRGLSELAIVCTSDISDNDVMKFAAIDTLDILCIATNAQLTCERTFKLRNPNCYFFIQEPSDEVQ
jgi:hypothetical protein